MRIVGILEIRFLFWARVASFLVFAGNVMLRAQEEPLSLDPPLSEIFPLENLTDGVHLEYPVLINDHTVLRPDAILRFVFLDPNAATRARPDATDGGSGFHAHVGPGGTLSSGNDADSRAHDGGESGGWGNADGNEVAGIFDEKKEDAKRRKSELQNEVWKQKDLFDDALDHATELGTTFVYSVPPRGDPLLASLDLPEGMLLGEVAGHVRVLALKEDSRAFGGGIRPGDEIRSFNTGGHEVKTLVDFMHEFSATKHQAKVTGDPNYTIIVWRASTSETISARVAAPPSLPSFLNDSYSSPVDQRH